MISFLVEVRRLESAPTGLPEQPTEPSDALLTENGAGGDPLDKKVGLLGRVFGVLYVVLTGLQLLLNRTGGG